MVDATLSSGIQAWSDSTPCLDRRDWIRRLKLRGWSLPFRGCEILDDKPGTATHRTIENRAEPERDRDVKATACLQRNDGERITDTIEKDLDLILTKAGRDYLKSWELALRRVHIHVTPCYLTE